MTVELETEVIACLSRGRKVEAIKTLRAIRGIGLKEAKKIVDIYCNEHRFNTSVVQRKSSLNLLSLIAFVVIVYLMFKWFT